MNVSPSCSYSGYFGFAFVQWKKQRQTIFIYRYSMSMLSLQPLYMTAKVTGRAVWILYSTGTAMIGHFTMILHSHTFRRQASQFLNGLWPIISRNTPACLQRSMILNRWLAGGFTRVWNPDKIKLLKVLENDHQELSHWLQHSILCKKRDTTKQRKINLYNIIYMFYIKMPASLWSLSRQQYYTITEDNLVLIDIKPRSVHPAQC